MGVVAGRVKEDVRDLGWRRGEDGHAASEFLQGISNA